jgi:hypothetical protein
MEIPCPSKQRRHLCDVEVVDKVFLVLRGDFIFIL